MPKYATTKSERDLLKLLRLRYKPPSHAVLAQVSIPADGDHTAPRRRRVDALAIGAWRSRGSEILGFEMKADRGSWTKELEDPKKAEDWARFCDGWFVVAHKGVVKAGEVPPKWGFYEARTHDLVLVKPAEQLSPEEPSRWLFFSLFQAIMYQIHPEPKDAELERRYQQGFMDGSSEARRHFLAALRDVPSPKNANDLSRLDKLLSIGPFADRPQRVSLVERLVELFTKWNSLRPTEGAIQAVEFMVGGGLPSLSSRLGRIKEQVQILLSEIEAREKTVADAAEQTGPQ